MDYAERSTLAALRRPALWELLAALIAALLFVVIVASAREAQPFRKTGDTLLYEQVTQNIAQGKGAISEIFASTQYAIDHSIASERFPRYEELADDFRPGSRNILRFHANYVLYALAPFADVFGAGPVLSIFQVGSFVGMLLALYWWLRRRQSSPLAVAG